MSDVMQKFLESLQIQHTVSSVGHPESNGMVERSIGTLLSLLKTCADGNPDWDLLLPFVLFQYRSTAHSATGLSPFELLFGKHLGDSVVPVPISPSISVSEHYTRLNKARDFVMQHYNRIHDVSVPIPDGVSVGSYVWLKKDKCKKMEPPYEGPYEVLEVISPQKIKISQGRGTSVINLSHCKICN